MNHRQATLELLRRLTAAGELNALAEEDLEMLAGVVVDAANGGPRSEILRELFTRLAEWREHDHELAERLITEFLRESRAQAREEVRAL